MLMQLAVGKKGKPRVITEIKISHLQLYFPGIHGTGPLQI